MLAPSFATGSVIILTLTFNSSQVFFTIALIFSRFVFLDITAIEGPAPLSTQPKTSSSCFKFSISSYKADEVCPAEQVS